MAAARRRSLPSNQYDCPTCGGRHVYDSERGIACRSGGVSARPRRSPRRPSRTNGGRRTASRTPPIPAVRPPPPRIPRPRTSEENARLPQTSRRTGERRAERAAAERRLADQRFAIDEAVLTYVFDEDGFYEQLADKLIEKAPIWRRNGRGHWLCRQLNEAAEALDPGTWAKQAGRSVRDGLRALGLPRYMADALGAGSGVTLKIAFGRTSLDSLSKALRVLIPLVCPDFTRCPAGADVVKTLASPAIAERLKTMATT